MKKSAGLMNVNQTG